MKKKWIAVHLAVLLLLAMAAVMFCEEAAAFKHETVKWIRKTQMEQTLRQARQADPLPDPEEEWYDSARLIYHAGGAIDGLAYTNSREALEDTLLKGNYMVEIDFLFTEDNRLICAHEWQDLYSLKPLTWKQITELGIYRKYTPMTAEDLLSIMEEEPRMRVVLDTKEKEVDQVVTELIRLAEGNGDLLNRLIIQVYDWGMKPALQELYPFRDENFLFTTYQFGEERSDEILKLCKKENIGVVTVKQQEWSQEVVDQFLAEGFVLFEYTINDAQEARETLARGIRGIYTDVLQPADLEEAS